ncbi:MAG TPA: hypothetical protein VFI47_14490 [Acidimicrobiales bacterium]|nr:hypothetical protein [Acidimicrobiales bacterium]
MTTGGIVTGAGRGMGAASAVRLADMVDALRLVDLDEEASFVDEIDVPVDGDVAAALRGLRP